MMLYAVNNEALKMSFRRWKHITILFLILTCVRFSSQECNLPTVKPLDSTCLCESLDSFNGWSYTCISNSDFEVIFGLKYVIDSSVTIQCGHYQPNYESLLQELDLTEVHTFVFKSCSLPNTSFGEIIPYNEKYPVEQIKVESKRDNRTFTHELFNNVSETLKSLILSNNKIQMLPESLFSNFSELKYLSLSDNMLKTLPENIFSNLKNLIVLEIANNYLELLPQGLFQNLTQLEKLYLYKNRVKDLPNGLFKSLVNLKVLDLADNHLILLPNAIFHGLSSVVHVRLRGNWLGTIPEGLFSNCSNLQEIDLSLNRFMEPLPEHLLHEVPRLENVSLHDCNLTHIHESFFSFSPNITHLRLENNRLSVLPEKIFRNNTVLKELNLNFNSIKELPENLFPNQKYLEKLFLFKNNISVLPNGIFKYTRNIKTLVLGGNKLQTIGRAIFRDLPNLEELDLSKNNLTYFSLDFNEYIKLIDLSYNNLTQMPSINWLQHLKLEKLNMDYNKLTYIEIPVLYSTNRRNPTLNIAHNNIKTVSVQDILINDQTIKDLPSKDYESYVETSVSLASNPFLCDCRIYSFYDYLKGNNEAHKRSVRFTRTQDLTCQEPPKFANQPLVQLRPNQFTCDLNENCSASCHCYIRAEDNARVVNCSNLKLKSLPRFVPLNTSVLYFQGNMLASMDDFNIQMWENLTDLYLDGNQITSLDHWSIPTKLKHLSLKGNHLRYLTSTFMDLLSDTKGFQISLSDNPWNCNCSTVTFKKWLTEHYQFVKDVKNIMCANRLKLNGTLMRKPILMIPDEVICPISDWPYKVQLISVTVICVILALLLFVVSVLYYRNKQTVIAYVYIHMHNVFMCFFNEEDIDEDKTFDAFVSYSSSDRDVALRLIEELEDKEPHFKLCIHERNWIAGNQISWNIFNSVHNSRKTILVISKEFLESMWFQVEFHTAYYQMLEDKIDRLIIIVKGELPPKDTLDKDLQYLLSTKTYLVWEEKWFWEKLKYAMPHKKQQMLQNDVLALKDRPASEKIKTVENQIAIFSSGGNKTTGKVQEVVQNGTNKAFNLVNKETMNKK